MRRRAFLGILGVSVVAFGAQEAPSMDDLLDQGRAFLEENLDEGWLRALDDLDDEQVRDFLRRLQTELLGDQVLDLSTLRDPARKILPLLEASESTQPYAEWLRSRLDYLEVAEELRAAEPPPPEPKPGVKPMPRVNPPAEQERKVWRKQVEQRPEPIGAAGLVAKLKPIFAAEGAPEALVWVAEAESSFNAKAKSPAGAAGLFQLMPTTAKDLGLSLFPWDERFDTAKSARAASRHMARLNRKFKDWRLSLAAYNAGEGLVNRLLKQHKTRSYEAISPYLPAETQMYVPKIEALLMRREKVELTRLPIVRG